MWEWLSHQNAGEVTGLTAVVGAFSVAIASVVFSQWRRVRFEEMRSRQVETEAALKQEMVQRGMSADEIVRVLDSGAGTKPTEEECRRQLQNDAVHGLDETSLMQQMIDNGMSADEIIRVLETARKKPLRRPSDEPELARKG